MQSALLSSSVHTQAFPQSFQSCCLKRSQRLMGNSDRDRGRRVVRCNIHDRPVKVNTSTYSLGFVRINYKSEKIKVAGDGQKWCKPQTYQNEILYLTPHKLQPVWKTRDDKTAGWNVNGAHSFSLHGNEAVVAGLHSTESPIHLELYKNNYMDTMMVYPGGKGLPIPREIIIHMQQTLGKKKEEVANLWNIKK